MMPRAAKLGSFCNSIVSSTAPAGMPPLPTSAIASCLVWLSGPGGDDRIDLRLARDAVGGGGVAGIADQVLASDQFQQPVPVVRDWRGWS